jgi:hypothetical protein
MILRLVTVTTDESAPVYNTGLIVVPDPLYAVVAYGDVGDGIVAAFRNGYPTTGGFNVNVLIEEYSLERNISFDAKILTLYVVSG